MVVLPQLFWLYLDSGYRGGFWITESQLPENRCVTWVISKTLFITALFYLKCEVIITKSLLKWLLRWPFVLWQAQSTLLTELIGLIFYTTSHDNNVSIFIHLRYLKAFNIISTILGVVAPIIPCVDMIPGGWLDAILPNSLFSIIFQGEISRERLLLFIFVYHLGRKTIAYTQFKIFLLTLIAMGSKMFKLP